MSGKFAIILLYAHITAPGCVTAGFSHGFLVGSDARASANADSARLVRCANGLICFAGVRHERLGRPFPRVEHFREAGVGLKNEASATNRQRPPEYFVLSIQRSRRGV